jgi:hypothetical protein
MVDNNWTSLKEIRRERKIFTGRMKVIILVNLEETNLIHHSVIIQHIIQNYSESFVNGYSLNDI